MDDMYAQVSGTVTRTSGDAPSDPWWGDVSTAFAQALSSGRQGADPDGSGVAGTVSGQAGAQITPPDGVSNPDAGDVSRAFTAGALISGITTPAHAGVAYGRYVPGLVAAAWQGLTFTYGGASWQVKVVGVSAGVHEWPLEVEPPQE